MRVHHACEGMDGIRDKIETLERHADINLFAMWTDYPEASGEEQDYCIILFFADVQHWTNWAIFNRSNFQERLSKATGAVDATLPRP